MSKGSIKVSVDMSPLKDQLQKMIDAIDGETTQDTKKDTLLKAAKTLQEYCDGRDCETCYFHTPHMDTNCMFIRCHPYGWSLKDV